MAVSKRSEAWERKQLKTSMLRFGFGAVVLLGVPGLLFGWPYLSMANESPLDYWLEYCGLAILLFVGGAALPLAAYLTNGSKAGS